MKYSQSTVLRTQPAYLQIPLKYTTDGVYLVYEVKIMTMLTEHLKDSQVR
jgi:hypothetical protein